MSAADQMRAMLDELMGTNRDGLDNNTRDICFDDPKVCKSYLLECCPHDILSGTRMDLGECHLIHDPALKADFRRESQALSHLESFIGDCDRRVETARAKLSETQEELSVEAQKKSDYISQIGEQIGTKLVKADELAAQGQVDESFILMKEVEELNSEKVKAENELKSSIPMSTYQQQKLRVCEACSAYLGIHDNDRRLADHFGGKLHLGFIQIRDKLEQLRKICEERNMIQKRRESMIRESSRRDCTRSRERDMISSSVRGRSRSRSPYRDRRNKHRRSRSRSRSHGRKREKKSRRHRSRSRS